MKNREEEGKQVHRVVTFLNRSQVDFLDKLGKDALFSTGMKFPRTRVISAMIDLLQKINLSGESLRTDQELEERVLRKLASGVPEAKRLAGEILQGEPHATPTRVRG